MSPINRWLQKRRNFSFVDKYVGIVLYHKFNGQKFDLIQITLIIVTNSHVMCFESINKLLFTPISKIQKDNTKMYL